MLGVASLTNYLDDIVLHKACHGVIKQQAASGAVVVNQVAQPVRGLGHRNSLGGSSSCGSSLKAPAFYRCVGKNPTPPEGASLEVPCHSSQDVLDLWPARLLPRRRHPLLQTSAGTGKIDSSSVFWLFWVKDEHLIVRGHFEGESWRQSSSFRRFATLESSAPVLSE